MVGVTPHKFAVGQTVRFSPGGVERYTARQGEVFRVLRLLPEEGNALQYRIKSEEDGHERVVREGQLTSI